MGMPAWNDIPYCDPMGGGHYAMDIAPDFGCPNCGQWKWHVALVNSNERYDLLTNRKLATWSVKSECKVCHDLLIWHAHPDKPYPRTNDPLPE